jgi:hypothetical protein
MGTSLQDTCFQWRRLAEAEGQAMRAGNWPLVADCQAALQELQGPLSSQIAQARQQLAASRSSVANGEEQLRNLLLPLMDLEKRNLNWLATRRQRLSQQVEQLGRTSRNLRRIHRSYSPAAPPDWTSLT